MKNYCVVCFAKTEKFNREIVGVCEELKQPLCREHGSFCEDDGHKFIPLTNEQKEDMIGV